MAEMVKSVSWFHRIGSGCARAMPWPANAPSMRASISGHARAASAPKWPAGLNLAVPISWTPAGRSCAAHSMDSASAAAASSSLACWGSRAMLPLPAQSAASAHVPARQASAATGVPARRDSGPAEFACEFDMPGAEKGAVTLDVGGVEHRPDDAYPAAGYPCGEDGDVRCLLLVDPPQPD